MFTDSILLNAIIAFSHPILMLLLLAGSFYALYLGVQVRRSRTTDDTDLRKELVKEKFNQRHYQLGSVLLAMWIVGGIGGMAATYTLYNKLFVSPHLLVGLASVGMVAMAASLAPFMQKGKSDTVRTVHIVFTSVLLGLVMAQTFTGIKIVQKVLGDVLDNAA